MELRGRVLGCLAGAAVLAGGVMGPTGGAYAVSSTFQTPAYSGDFPDPSVLISGGAYWAYSTGSGGRQLQVMSSPDMKTWSAPADPLSSLPSWAGAGHTWAPGVIQIGATFVMYYTARDTSLGIQCISVATSSTPGGPFTDSSTGPFVCQTGDGGSIDPNPYVDPASGGLYLLWKSDDNSLGLPTHIWGQRLAPDGLGFATGTSPVLLLNETAPWQSPAVEGPTVVLDGTTYYLFYGANSWNSPSSGIGYATSHSLLGSYTNQSPNGPWLGSKGNATGPQGPMVFRDLGGVTRMAFAAWYGAVGYSNGGVRALWIGSLGFNRLGKPTIS